MPIPKASKRIRGNKIWKAVPFNIVTIKWGIPAPPKLGLLHAAAFRELSNVQLDIQTWKTLVDHNWLYVCLAESRTGNRDRAPAGIYLSQESLLQSRGQSVALKCQLRSKKIRAISVGAGSPWLWSPRFQLCRNQYSVTAPWAELAEFPQWVYRISDKSFPRKLLSRFLQFVHSFLNSDAA